MFKFKILRSTNVISEINLKRKTSLHPEWRLPKLAKEVWILMVTKKKTSPKTKKNACANYPNNLEEYPNVTTEIQTDNIETMWTIRRKKRKK